MKKTSSKPLKRKPSTRIKPNRVISPFTPEQAAFVEAQIASNKERAELKKLIEEYRTLWRRDDARASLLSDRATSAETELQSIEGFLRQNYFIRNMESDMDKSWQPVWRKPVFKQVEEAVAELQKKVAEMSAELHELKTNGCQPQQPITTNINGAQMEVRVIGAGIQTGDPTTEAMLKAFRNRKAKLKPANSSAKLNG